MAETVAATSMEGTAPGIGNARFWTAAAVVIVVLFAAYWFFVRADYVPILADLEPKDAASIAKVLDGKKIEYRIADNGTSIEVLRSEADKARVELAGSELPMVGQIGFELFNQSDMGLTEFAQKINYQRALQGELARTILLIDGIQTVRVHLGLPERSVFRSERAPPKASVALVLRPGRSLSEASVQGIQRLVAGSVPEMMPYDVAVLDGRGKIVSQILPVAPGPDGDSDVIVQNLRGRLAESFGRNLPTQKFGINVSLRYRLPVPTERIGGPNLPETQRADEIVPRGSPDYSIAVRITTAAPVDESMRMEVERLVVGELGFAAGRGDSLVFLVGPVIPDLPSTPELSGSDKIVARSNMPSLDQGRLVWPDWWPLVLALAAVLAIFAIWSFRRRATSARRDHLASFAEALRLRLEADGGV